MTFKTLIASALLAAVSAAHAGQSLIEAQPTLTLQGARAVIAAGEAEARRLGAGGAIAVTDAGGHVLALARLDGTFPAASSIAIEKARSAAQFRKETSVFENAVRDGRVALVANGALLPLQGGVPVLVGDQVVGAVGVAGAQSAPQDTEIAKAAAAALATTEQAAR